MAQSLVAYASIGDTLCSVHEETTFNHLINRTPWVDQSLTESNRLQGHKTSIIQGPLESGYGVLLMRQPKLSQLIFQQCQRANLYVYYICIFLFFQPVFYYFCVIKLPIAKIIARNKKGPKITNPSRAVKVILGPISYTP